jgi:hypothetical protein
LQADDLKALEALGFSLPTPAYLIGAILFGIVGYAAYRYGKKKDAPRIKWLAAALMLYPYAVSDTWLLYLVGTVLCVGLYVFRE